MVMEPVRVPSIIADKLRPHARETLARVKKFVEEECMPYPALGIAAF
jgi:hypothetical protein